MQVEERIAKLFTNGASQAVRLPSEFRFQGTEVYIRRDERSGEVILSPKTRRSWASFEALRAELEEDLSNEGLKDFMKDRQQPEDAPRDPFEGWTE
ncbi:antitoxin [Xenophilus sp. Marseille-Q4582]|uniref:antitoxin n=1 Tax=Xenophilus sp. Marseille-Q4582 TaxID=2866600 RepID=UPI001CE475E5|nr:AbrB/MazE/SpoVT family DNA-binding domain-containing protein [Xenophilus sp. Marseille-Q4582]